MNAPDLNRIPRRVALIGGGGFLGTNLARHLIPRVDEVRGLDRQRPFPDALAGVSWFDGDLCNAEALDAILQGCDSVVHLASTSSPANADQDMAGDAEANVVASLRLFDRCMAAGVERVVFLSSGGTVYGIPERVPLAETAPTQPITAYGVAKLAIEKYLAVYARQRGLDFRVLRISNPYGPFQTASRGQGVVAAFLSNALAGRPLEIWGDGRVVRDYLFVDDVSAAIGAALCHRGAARVFNIGSGAGLSLLEVIAAIETLLGCRLATRFLDGRVADVPVSVLDCRLAEGELGWRAATPLIQGLERTLAWLRSPQPGRAP